MSRLLLLLTLGASLLWFATRDAWGHDLVCVPPDFSTAHTLTIKVCDGATLYRGPDGGFVVVCPGHSPPAGSIEMREYYKRGERG